MGLHITWRRCQTVRPPRRRRGEALNPPQGRPSAERTARRDTAVLSFISTLSRLLVRRTAPPVADRSILLCGTLLEALLALGPQVRRGKKLGNPFSTYTKKRDKSGRVAGVFSGPCTSPEAFGGLEQLLVFLLGSTGPGADVSQNHTYLLVRTQIPIRSPATIEVLVRRGRIFTGSAEEHTLAAAGTGAATFADESYALPK